MCVCVSKCNVSECYSAVLVIRLTYTSTKTCIKSEWHDYGEYIYPLSISKLREGYALSKCFSFSWCLPPPPHTTSVPAALSPSPTHHLSACCPLPLPHTPPQCLLPSPPPPHTTSVPAALSPSPTHHLSACCPLPLPHTPPQCLLPCGWHIAPMHGPNCTDSFIVPSK